MTVRRRVCAAIALGALGWTGCASHVVPGGGVADGSAANTARPAAACNLWSFLLPTAQQRQALCNCICGTPLGQMANSMLKPASMLSGGLVPTLCPGPDQVNPADLAKPADSAEGAAARIKQSEADAKARRAAVRYLATVDCKRFPEAEAALVNSLLADTSQCVRLEAAAALGTGCCCTPATIKALTQSVSGQSDNDPPERSQRVRQAAAVALERCLARCADQSDGEARRPESPLPPEAPYSGAAPPADPLPAPGPLGPLPPLSGPQTSMDGYIEQARRALADYYASNSAPPIVGVPIVGVPSVGESSVDASSVAGQSIMVPADPSALHGSSEQPNGWPGAAAVIERPVDRRGLSRLPDPMEAPER